VGLKATPAEAGGAVVLLGDMPKVEAGLINALIEAFLAQPHARAVAPLQSGRRGNPVLLGRTLFAEAERLSGDQGARRLLNALDSRSVVEIEAHGYDVSFDVDRPSDLA
jgi:molybdenum cofactor cytidylyltransferase